MNRHRFRRVLSAAAVVGIVAGSVVAAAPATRRAHAQRPPEPPAPVEVTDPVDPASTEAGTDSAVPAVDPGVVSMIANPEPITIRQPDGRTFTAIAHGNGSLNWLTTESGASVVRSADGTWYFATGTDADGRLVAGPDRADLAERAPRGTTIRPSEPVATTSATTEGTDPGVGDSVSTNAVPFQHQGVERTLVILAQFADVAGSSTAAYWNNLFFGANGSLRAFYLQASHGTLDLQPAADSSGTLNDGIVGWVTLNFNHPDLGDLKTADPQATIAAAIVAADPYVNFTAYDTNGSPGIQPDELHVTVIMAGTEASVDGGAGMCGTKRVWGHQWELPTAPVVDGRTVGRYGYTTFGERHCSQPGVAANDHFATLGIIAHEMGHDLGFPDLYDVDGSSIGGVGRWSLMASGSWNTANGGFSGNTPALPDAFMRTLQGWVVPTELTTSNGVGVATAATTADVKRLRSNPNGIDWAFEVGSGTGEYFLIENRQKTGFDAGLPGCGILIWHIDESVTYTSKANATDNHRLVQLLQADGANHLSAAQFANSAGDTGDPYPGSSNNSSFGSATNPNSSLYSGASSGVSLTVTSGACAPTMTINVVTPGGAPTNNDAFANATSVSATSTSTGSTSGATRQSGEPPHGANPGGSSVWWKFTPGASGSVTVDTQGSSFDTLLGVYTGAAVDTLTTLASNDDAPGLNTQSQVKLDVVAGTTYFVAVDGYRDPDTSAVATGAVTLHLTFSGSALTPPANDAFAAATNVPVTSGVAANVAGPTFGATKQAGEPNHVSSAGGASAWWKITPAFSGTLELSTAGSGFDTLLAVYTGASVGALTPVPGASNDDADNPNGVYTSFISPFNVTGGTTYYVAVDGWSAIRGHVKLKALFTASGGPTVPSTPPAPTASLNGAQVNVAFSAPGSNGGSAIIDYRVTASPGGTTVTTTTSPAVFASLPPNTYTFTVVAHNAVGDSSPSPASNAVLVPATSSVNDAFANAVAVGSASTSMGSTVGATRQSGEPAHGANPGGASVWWKFTPGGSGSVTVDTQGSSFDTLLGVYTGSAVDSLTPVAANDDGPGLGVQSHVQFDVSGGSTYFVAVDGYRNRATNAVATGSVTLHVTFSGAALGAPANDAFTNATAIAVSDGVEVDVSGATFGASKQPGEPDHVSSGGASAWWKITAPANGTLELSTAGSGFDTLLAVYTGATVGALTAVPGASNDDSDPSSGVYTSAVGQFAVTGGTTYAIAVDGWSGTRGHVSLHALFTAGGVTTPGAPTGVMVAAGDAQVSVSWSAPLADGGAAIDSYTVTAQPGGASCQTGALSCTVSGLTNGVTYSFTVTAHNSEGNGPASSPAMMATPQLALPMVYAGSSKLSSGKVLLIGTYLLSADARTLFGLRPDGNLILVVENMVVWESDTAGSGATTLLMTKSGDLQLFGLGGLVWSTGTSRRGASLQVLDGWVAVRYGSTSYWSQGGLLLPLKAKGSSTLSSGSTLKNGYYLRSPNRQCVAGLVDGELVVWGPGGRVRWRSGTVGATKLKLFSSGNLQLLDVFNMVVWATNTAGRSPKLAVTDGCRLVLAARTTTLWLTP